MQKLVIAVDPGFDSMKVVANGKLFKFPFNVVETDERKMSDYKLRDSFMLYQDDLGGTYRVGEYAREILFDNKSNVDSFYTTERFVSNEFKIGLETAIGIAIKKNGFLPRQGDLDIHLIIALPHACRDKYESTVKGSASGHHKYMLRLGTEKPCRFSYKIEEANVKIISQTIAAMLGETSDDDGYVDEDKYQFISEGPTLVLDGGYYTMGMVVISRSGIVDEEKTESDTKHAMANVNEAIVSQVREVRQDITHYSVEYLLNVDNGILKYIDSKTGKAAKLDLRQLRQEKIVEVCNSLIEYLNARYNRLLDFNFVMVTGGTGACFYPHLLEYYNQRDQFLDNTMVLTSSQLNGVNNPIEYAIAIGAYKGLQGILHG